MTSRTVVDTPKLMTSLTEPWDARWLAKTWPDVFELVSDDLGTVAVKDLEEANKLVGKVELGSDGLGLILRVFGVDHALIIG